MTQAWGRGTRPGHESNRLEEFLTQGGQGNGWKRHPGGDEGSSEQDRVHQKRGQSRGDAAEMGISTMAGGQRLEHFHPPMPGRMGKSVTYGSPRTQIYLLRGYFGGGVQTSRCARSAS